ncbi:DMT family transporter [Alteribacillus sp. JSM 102045]|uniref:DMT family transporter n=1 Tax=Alteribacillus sp. JSM 102045 TaxID=1562101 RepID=UPI0035BFA573
MNQQSNIWINYLLVIGVMVLWGINVVALKVLVEYMSPASMQALRIMTAGIVIFIIMSYLKEWQKLSRKEFKHIAVASLFGVIGHHLFLAWGLMTTSAVNTSLILALVPLTTSILAMLLLGDPVTKIRFLGVILGFIGVSMLTIAGSGSQVSGLSSGDILVFLGMFSQAVSFIYIKKATTTLHPRVMTGFMFFIGSIGLFFISLFVEPGGIIQLFTAPLFVWLIFFGSAVLATALGHQLFNSSIQKIGAGETAVFNNLVPFFGLISSAFLLKETVYPAQLTGFIFIVGGVLLGTGYVEQKWDYSRRKVKEN